MAVETSELETTTPTRASRKVPGSGRQRGTPNKSTAEIKALARVEGPACIELLAAFRDDASHPVMARIEAIKVLLDRGYGRPSQSVAVDVSMHADFDDWPDDKLAEYAESLARLIRAEAQEQEALRLLPAAIDAEVVEK